jgi:dCMP deaminase
MNERFTDFYMDIAYRTAQMSRAKRLQVGSVLVKDDAIISYGWNGTPAGWDNDCEDKVWDKGAGGWISPEEFDEQYPYEGWHEGAQRNVRYGLKTKPEVLHAEANCLMKVAKSHNSTDGAALFITHSPCIECAKLIYQSGINRVYFGNAYRDSDGIDFLTKSGVEVTKLDAVSRPTT